MPLPLIKAPFNPAAPFAIFLVALPFLIDLLYSLTKLKTLFPSSKVISLLAPIPKRSVIPSTNLPIVPWFDLTLLSSIASLNKVIISSL